MESTEFMLHFFEKKLLDNPFSVEVYGCGFLLLHFACAGKPSQTLVHGRCNTNRGLHGSIWSI
ncbi:hypothetical protein NC653_031121 [Populus alba x Populus x berolinensis]|uniref:Uncharacterized protein n=1 Tax=Populus alba x Populus x berolinensis TaxID=444605 RepID=A0AAD6Q2Y9_9ROSI|nr:hypothetical protein NC653_031121 [Populus alba x Populus x berolinensis]